MTVNPRRPGFRLPWTGEGEAEEASETVDGAVDQADGGDEATQPSVERAATTTAPPAETTPEAGTATTGSADASSEANDFLKSLVAAMRGVAEESRDAGLAELRESVDRRVEGLRAAAAQRADEIRRRADLDMAGIAEWQRAEIERIKAEAEQREQARRQQLEQQLAHHDTSADAQIEQARHKLEEHERDLAAFFTQLSEINDPAAFVAAARRIPAPPDLESESTPGSAPREALNARLQALGMDKAARPAAPAAEAATGDATTTAATEPEAATTSEPMAAEAEAALSTNGTAPDAAVEEPSGTRDAALAERLAELDQRLADTAPAPSTPVTAAEPGSETSTAIVVKGLGSFGAITSFKQALEKVEGVRGVTLSLGPTGEFVYRASHTTAFDVPAAIRAIEGDGVEIEPGDGGLRVTVSRGR
jgi:hypothetical protein